MTTVAYSECEGLVISQIGLGTYLGPADDLTDARLRAVVLDAADLGVTYIDCAANYRCGRSEQVVGNALATLTGGNRKPIVVGTKAGYLPYDGTPPGIDDVEYFTTRYVDGGIVQRDWIVGDWQCFHPEYLDWQFSQSVARLQRPVIDIFYLHNPEALLLHMEKEAFLSTIREAFAWCVSKVRAGNIKFFGLSTWGGLLNLSPREAIDLRELSRLANAVGGQEYFKFIQAPFSAGMTHALTHRTQQDARGHNVSLLRLTAELGIHFLASAPLMHGELIGVDCPDEIRTLFPWPLAVQTYLDFARSSPGVAAAIVGTMQQSHLREAAELLQTRPNATAFRALLP